MLQRNKSAEKWQLVSCVAMGERLRAAIRLYVGTGRRYTVKDVARGTGLAIHYIDSVMAGPGAPEWREAKASTVASLCGFLGPEFTTDWLALCGQGAFDLADDPEPGAVRTIGCDAVDDAAEINRATIDDVLDADERKRLRPVALRSIARAGRLLAA